MSGTGVTTSIIIAICFCMNIPGMMEGQSFSIGAGVFIGVIFVLNLIISIRG